MNRREMKKLVKRRLGSFLLIYGPSVGGRTPWKDVPDFFYELELWAYGREGGSAAERRRLRLVIGEIIEDFQRVKI